MADPRRVVLIGKSGSGKSSLANTIFGGSPFTVNHSSDSKSKFSEAQTRTVNGLPLTLIDTPGIFNADRTKDEVDCEVFSCLTQSAPGPHALLFVLLVEKFTEQEQAIADQIKLHFGEDVFRYTTVVFTHGDQLQVGTEIMEFVNQSKGLKDLIEKCGGRCHVIDNKYWKNDQDSYRSNSVQVGKIINSIQITVENNGDFFTNEKLERVERDIMSVQNSLFKSQALSLEESREQAKAIVLQNYITATKRRRYGIKIITGMSIFAIALITYKVFGYVRERAVSGPVPGVDEGLPSSVMEVVQEVVAPIKSALDYIVEAIEAIFMTKHNVTSNRTHALSE